MLMGKIIKSSVRVKPSRAYYQNMVNRLNANIYRLHAECERIDPTGCAPITPEEAAIRRKIDTLTDKRNWAVRMVPVATTMEDELKRKAVPQ